MKEINAKKEFSDQLQSHQLADALLLEAAWEVCNPIGGIHTVIRSKASIVCDKWQQHYCLLGPYFSHSVASVFDPVDDESCIFYQATQLLKKDGYEVYFGNWLIAGRPRVVLFNPNSLAGKLNQIKYFLWEEHEIASPGDDKLLNQVIAFGHLMYLFLEKLSELNAGTRKIIAHFHEWMAGLPIPQIRRKGLPITNIFTTHATLAGRYLAMNETNFYENLPHYDWLHFARQFAIEPQVRIERAAAHGAQVFTTVSEVTANECKCLLGRNPDLILPNGLNIERFTAMHELQNLHVEFKEKIHQFTMAHFFQHSAFDLENTIYFFTSGRFEYRNKGFDLTLNALKKLNLMLKKSNSDKTVVMFFITKQPYHSINPEVLQSRGVMEELRQTCLAIQRDVGKKLFYEAAASIETRFPNLNNFIDDYWKLRYRRTIQSWKSNILPPVVTHNLVNEKSDPILDYLQKENLLNHKEDKVKIVYHPEFINTTNPLFGIEYGQFVRGCNLGVFPSYYEPWGYTPLECIASGVPAITSDLSGFGDHVLKTMPDHAENGVYVIARENKDLKTAADQLAFALFDFLKLDRRERIELRNKVDHISPFFDWKVLFNYYENAYKLATKRG